MRREAPQDQFKLSKHSTVKDYQRKSYGAISAVPRSSPALLTSGRTALVTTSTVDEAVDLKGQPLDRFGQLEEFGRELVDDSRPCRWIVPRAVHEAERLANPVRNPDDCHA